MEIASIKSVQMLVILRRIYRVFVAAVPAQVPLHARETVAWLQRHPGQVEAVPLAP